MKKQYWEQTGWVLRSPNRVKVLKLFKLPLTPNIVAKKTNMSLTHASKIIRELAIKKLLKCLNEKAKPIAAKAKNTQSVVHEPFVDYNTGNIMQGLEYWRPLSGILYEYINHPEDKFDGDTGLLQRKQIIIDKLIYIGKETNNIEDQYLEKPQIEHYVPDDFSKMTWKEAKQLGISKSTYYRSVISANNKFTSKRS